MGELVNLRRARKDKARTERDAAAAQNRATFGRTKAEKERSAAERAIADKTIDAHRREP
jgi:hypothetical protein